MSTLILALALAALLAVVVLIVASAATDDDEHEPRTYTHDDPRCREVARKLDDARRMMIARGVPLLLDDNRRPWKRGNVIEFRR